MIDIKIGTSMDKTTPLNIDINVNSLPENRTITGNVVSIDVAPPEAIGASLPKYFAIKGAKSKVSTSLEMFAISAITPNFSPAYSEIKTLDRL